MLFVPRANKSNTLRKANVALPDSFSSGIGTRRSNPGQPAISLEGEQGGIKILIKDSSTPGLHSLQSKNESANYLTELTDASTDSSSACSDGEDAYTYGGTFDIAPPSIPSDIAEHLTD
jgi:hypothetical protein